MKYIVYKIANNVNGKFYIGVHKTNNIDDNYFGSGLAIKRAIEKYGKECFTKHILHIFDNSKEAFDKEKELVVLSESSYNLKELSAPISKSVISVMSARRSSNPGV